MRAQPHRPSLGGNDDFPEMLAGIEMLDSRLGVGKAGPQGGGRRHGIRTNRYRRCASRAGCTDRLWNVRRRRCGNRGCAAWDQQSPEPDHLTSLPTAMRTGLDGSFAASTANTVRAGSLSARLNGR